jgi:chemotaxis regulatin CheY-phosphate phosphatase CheZ
MEPKTAANEIRYVIEGELADARSSARNGDSDRARRRVDDACDRLEYIARMLDAAANAQSHPRS